MEGFVYLTSVMDLYSRKIIAWTLSKTLEVEEVLKCIEMARKRRKTADPVIIHSDRGVHYTSKLYKKLTKGLILSYSKKGTPLGQCMHRIFSFSNKKRMVKSYFNL